MEKKGGIFVIVYSIFLVLFHLEYQLDTFSLPESQALQLAAAPGSDADPGWLSASWSATRAAVQARRQWWGRWWRQSCRQASSGAGSIVGGQRYKQPCGQQSRQAAVQAELRAGRKQCR